MLIQIKGKVYKSMIRPVMMYGAEAWTLTRKEEELLVRAEMRMLQWILGVSLRDRRRNENIREVLGVACITDKVREARIRWYGHEMRMEDGCCIKRIMNAEVYGRTSRGRQKKRWRDKIQEDPKTLKLKKEDADDQVKSSIRLLCKCHRETNYILIIAVTDASMIYRERTLINFILLLSPDLVLVSTLSLGLQTQS